MRHSILALLLIFTFSIVEAADQPKDIKGSQDSPLANRYPGSVIDRYVAKQYDGFELPIGKVGSDGKPATQHLEGKITRIEYTHPQDRSQLEVFKNYETALKTAGFETLFACNGDDCGIARFKMTSDWSDVWYGVGHIVYTGKLTRTEGDIYVNLHVALGTTNFDIIELKPMQTSLITINADALKSDMNKSGHVAIYGIYFDTGKAEIKPESNASLQEISKFLQQNATVKLYIVGHTDNSGDFQMNMDLSRRRAESVLKALTTNFGVSADRLLANGVSSLAPVASNKDEEGKAKNRRVELVER